MKEIYIPAAFVSIRGGQGKLWIINLHKQSQLIHKEMCIGTAEPVQYGELNVIEVSYSADYALEETAMEFGYRAQSDPGS